MNTERWRRRPGTLRRPTNPHRPAATMRQTTVANPIRMLSALSLSCLLLLACGGGGYDVMASLDEVGIPYDAYDQVATLLPVQVLGLDTAEPALTKPASEVAARQVEVLRVGGPPAASAAVPGLAGLAGFTAKPPYFIQTRSGTRRVRLGIYGSGDDVERDFDFVAPFVNPRTGHSNPLTIQAPVLVDGRMRHVNLSDTSTPRLRDVIPGDRVRLDGDRLLVAYRAGDPPSAEKCRVMINSWPVPTRQSLTWQLSFTLGGTAAEEAWPVTLPTRSPTLLWQLKADPGYPPMGFFVDTSPESPDLIQLTFFQRLNDEWTNDHRWVVPDLPRGERIDMMIQAVLDDRDGPQTTGQLKVWVNGRLLVSRAGRNLIPHAKDVHRWAFGVYLMAEDSAVNSTRVTQWHKARMLAADPLPARDR